MSSAAAVDLSQDLIEAVAWAESHFRSDALSPAGASGIMQLMPATAREVGVRRTTNASESIAGGAAYLRRLLDHYDGDVTKALAAYNAGPSAVDRYQGVPPFPETQRYVARILDHLATLSIQSED